MLPCLPACLPACLQLPTYDMHNCCQGSGPSPVQTSIGLMGAACWSCLCRRWMTWGALSGPAQLQTCPEPSGGSLCSCIRTRTQILRLAQPSKPSAPPTGSSEILVSWCAYSSSSLEPTSQPLRLLPVMLQLLACLLGLFTNQRFHGRSKAGEIPDIPHAVRMPACTDFCLHLRV